MFFAGRKIISASSCLHVTTLDLVRLEEDWESFKLGGLFSLFFCWLVSLIWELRKPNSFFLFNFFCTKTSLPSETHFATILPQQRWRHENIWRPKKKRKSWICVSTTSWFPNRVQGAYFLGMSCLILAGNHWMEGRREIYSAARVLVSFFWRGEGAEGYYPFLHIFSFLFSARSFLGIERRRRRIGSYCSLMMMYLVIIWFWSSSYSALPMFSSPEDLIQIRSWTGSFPLAES